MPELVLHEGYRPLLGLRETERAIKFVKDFFQEHLAAALNLQRVSAPLFLKKGSGINDDLNGVEAKATFRIKDDAYAEAECLFSLAKWKRMVLADYGFQSGEGLYTDMNAIRPDEECLDNLHSVYVDQWDWERVITERQRSVDFLKDIVRTIYAVLRDTEAAVQARYPQIVPILPKEIAFVHAEELLERWPDIGPRQRENRITAERGPVFVIGIGGTLADGTLHDGRAPDYDDWITPTGNGYKGLNGDILLRYPLLECLRWNGWKRNRLRPRIRNLGIDGLESGHWQPGQHRPPELARQRPWTGYHRARRRSWNRRGSRVYAVRE